MDLSVLTGLYDAYVDTFRGSDGTLSAMMQLKRDHTERVVANAAEIADGESFTPEERALSLAAALLHDTGRYEQLKRYNTFRDADSVDHAVFSYDIVREKGWTCDERILKAVLYHNRRELPEDIDRMTALVSHTVRDADKLDIFTVLEEQVANTDWRGDSRAFWNLAISAPPNPEVVLAIEERRPVDYSLIKSLADFVLIQVGWMISDLHFATSRRLCAGRGHLDFRRRFLHEITDDASVDRLCDLAAKEMGASPTAELGFEV